MTQVIMKQQRPTLDEYCGLMVRFFILGQTLDQLREVNCQLFTGPVFVNLTSPYLKTYYPYQSETFAVVFSIHF